MKIMVTGYSGSGKSTICRKLQDRYQLPALHLDTVQFLPGWKVRAKAGQQRIVQVFLNEHPDGWVIDGNYKALSYERRCEEADVIILCSLEGLPVFLGASDATASTRGPTVPT